VTLRAVMSRAHCTMVSGSIGGEGEVAGCWAKAGVPNRPVTEGGEAAHDASPGAGNVAQPLPLGDEA
jgi:hypothetical protein